MTHWMTHHGADLKLVQRYLCSSDEFSTGSFRAHEAVLALGLRKQLRATAALPS
jgi:hypothetical protein